MKFELVVWHEPGRITRDEAARRERDTLSPNAGVEAFRVDLASLAPDVRIATPASRYALVRMTADRVDEVSTEVYALARTHDLVCWDPERELVHNLGPYGVYPGMQLHTGEGLVVVDPDLDLVDDALQRLGPGNPFTSLVVFGQHFVQCSPLPGKPDEPEDVYELEYKQDGTIRRTTGTLSAVRLAFNEYATGERGFLDRLDWEG